MILDKLMEKKDLKTFIISRIKALENSKKEQLKLPEKKRHLAWKQLEGRIKELRYIKENIDNLKDLSKVQWGHF